VAIGGEGIVEGHVGAGTSPHQRGSFDRDDPVFADVTSALVNLGYRPAQARAAVTSVRPHVGAAPCLEVVVRAALKALRPAAGA